MAELRGHGTAERCRWGRVSCAVEDSVKAEQGRAGVRVEDGVEDRRRSRTVRAQMADEGGAAPPQHGDASWWRRGRAGVAGKGGRGRWSRAARAVAA